jgi:hypothetical protein
LKVSSDLVAWELKKQNKKNGIVVVADPPFQVKYEAQIKSMRCYAKARQYHFVLLYQETHPACKYIQDIFYMKPCLVAKHLEEQTANYTAVFLDADTILPVVERGMEEWLDVDADLQFYNRDWLPEVMSGIFFARNKPWVRDWLVAWSEMIFRRPPGFSSADNGALHIHLVETRIPAETKVAECRAMYENLTVGIENRTPYWVYVECTNAVLGPPAIHQACATAKSSSCGTVAIWPRLNFMAMDGHTLSFSISKFDGPVALHSIKKKADVAIYYRDVGSCQRNEEVFLGKKMYGQKALAFSRCCSAFLVLS